MPASAADSGTAAVPPERRPRSPAAPVARVPIGDGASLGSPQAPVTLVEFSDFGCPFCRLHFQQAFAQIRRDYVEAGLVRYVYRDASAGLQAPGESRAAEAAKCAGEQGRFWEMHGALFTARQAAGMGELKRLARSLPLDQAEFDACLADRTYATSVRSDLDDARRLGVVATPTFFIGRSGADGALEAVRLEGVHPVAAFRRLIAPLLASGP